MPPYLALAARLDGFDPYALSAAMEARQVVRIVSMRSALHTLTAADARALLPLVQPARDRELRVFRSRLAGAEPDRIAARARALVEEQPRTMAELRRLLAPAWPEADPAALAVAARCVLPLVQVTPRGLWGRSGQIALTTLDHWLGDHAGPGDGPADLTGLVRRYLAAFGPASVRDVQQWSGLTRLGEGVAEECEAEVGVAGAWPADGDAPGLVEEAGEVLAVRIGAVAPQGEGAPPRLCGGGEPGQAGAVRAEGL